MRWTRGFMVAAAVGALAAPTAAAEPQTVTCTDTAMVNPQLVKPSCNTAPINLPGRTLGRTTYDLQAAVVSGPSRAGASIRLIGGGPKAVCNGATSCAATRKITIVNSDPDPQQAFAQCRWELPPPFDPGQSVFARVTCTVTVETFPIAAPIKKK